MCRFIGIFAASVNNYTETSSYKMENVTLLAGNNKLEAKETDLGICSFVPRLSEVSSNKTGNITSLSDNDIEAEVAYLQLQSQ